MSTRSAGRLAWVLWAVGVAGCAAYVVLETTRHSADLSGTWFNAQEALGALVFPTVGAIVSIWISCDFVSSTFPTLSQARYFTVAVAGTLKGPL